MPDFSPRPIATAAVHAGIAIRYAFYIAATFVFAVLGISTVLMWHSESQQTPVGTASVVRISAQELARLKPTGNAAKFHGGWRDAVQFGQLHDRDTDFTLLVTMPSNPDDVVPGDFMGELAELRPIGGAIYGYPAAYYDLETRFGPVRAADFQLKTDGRIKLCMSYLSRFDTAALSYKGWYCEANGAKPSASTLACLLDRVTLTGPLPSAAAQFFFDARVKRPARCFAEPVTQTTDTGPPRPPRRLF